MKTYKDVEEKYVQKVIDKIKCDCCGKEFNVKRTEDDMEIQEMLIIDEVGGYGSIFGDGTRILCDICQECMKKLLGKYIRVEETESSLLSV